MVVIRDVMPAFELFQPADTYLAFIEVLDRDAPSIHVHALLTDLFLIHEILKGHARTTSSRS
jgi:hypothetical protein